MNFLSSKDAEEERIMHSGSGNIKLTSYNDANEVIDELFESLRLRCQGNLETSMRGIDFWIFDDWIKEKKATINLKNADDKCFNTQ